MESGAVDPLGQVENRVADSGIGGHPSMLGSVLWGRT